MFVRPFFTVAVSALVAVSLLVLASCTQPAREAEVTRQVEVPVEVTREVPVTVEVEREVEVAVDVTREIAVTREVPVTVEVVSEIEVTREVPVTVEVETIREVPVQVMVDVTREVYVTREVELIVEVTRETEVPVTVKAGESAKWSALSIFEGTNDASIDFCKEFVDETDSRTQFDFLTPINVALGNVEEDEEISPRYLLALVLNALHISLAAYDYQDDKENDWPQMEHVAEGVLLYDYCTNAIAYAEMP